MYNNIFLSGAEGVVTRGHMPIHFSTQVCTGTFTVFSIVVPRVFLASKKAFPCQPLELLDLIQKIMRTFVSCGMICERA